MRKIIFGLLTMGFFFHSCSRSSTETAPTEVESLTEQNQLDDAAISKYLNDHYLDNRGLIKAFSSTDTSDDHFTKLADLNPIRLSSGVIVIKTAHQPSPGKNIGENDILRIMCKNITFLSYKNDQGEVIYTSQSPFANSIDYIGVPLIDPYYFYVKNSILSTSQKSRSYYEIEGFKEGLQHFKSYEINDSENYNLQGVIIVPSRSAYARDEHFAPSTSLRNRNFVFNFQIYKSTARGTSED